MNDEAGKEIISINGTVIEFRPSRYQHVPGTEADAQKALADWKEDHSEHCAHCGVAITISAAILTHATAMWRSTPIWEVTRVVLERGKTLMTSDGVEILIHEACARIALPNVDWEKMEAEVRRVQQNYEHITRE